MHWTTILKVITILLLSYDADCLDGLGVGSEDSLIINNEVEDNVDNLDDFCFHTRSNDDPGTLSWDLDECSPTVTVSTTGT